MVCRKEAISFIYDGILDLNLLKKIRHLNLNRIWSLPDCHLVWGSFTRKLLSEETAGAYFCLRQYRIEISDSCRPELMESHTGIPAVPCLTAGGRNNGISCLRSHDLKKLQWSGCHHQVKFHLDPYSLHVLRSAAVRTSIKISLQWDGSGFWILIWNGSTVMPSTLADTGRTPPGDSERDPLAVWRTLSLNPRGARNTIQKIIL